MNLSISNRRVMIIVWSWNQSELNGPFDEWTISGTRQDIDKIIRLNEKVGLGEDPQLPKIIIANLQQSDLFVFLHRSHGYNSSHVQDILSSTRPMLHGEQVMKCFLFGEGNDHIYLAQNARGLLGTKGSFCGDFQRKGQLDATSTILDATFDSAQKMIKKEHFDSIWSYYGNSFKAKILELREALFSQLLPLQYPNGAEPASAYAMLRQAEHRLLLLRLLSFVGKMRKGSGLEEELKKFEFIDKKSYLFDDCNAHFKGTHGEGQSKPYEELSIAIKNSILSQKQSSDLVAMRNHFNALLEVMPEASFY